MNSKFENSGRSTDKEDLDLYNTECKKQENASNQSKFPPKSEETFSEYVVMAEACIPNEIGSHVREQVLTAKFQADSLIAL